MIRTRRLYAVSSGIGALLCVAGVFLCGVAPVSVDAHGSGASFEEEVGEYLVDVGYEPETIVAQRSAIFDFRLSQAEEVEQVSFDSVWVRIQQGERTVFATGINNPELGNAGLTYTFPTKGEYTLHVRYQQASETVAEVSFPLQVSPAPAAGADESESDGFLVPSALGALAGGIIGVAGMLLWRRRQ